jgi:predicted nucleic acid-binding protein
VVVLDYPAVRAAIGVSAEVQIAFCDALVVVAAARTGATVLYTEDLNDGQEILGVRISNPFTA